MEIEQERKFLVKYHDVDKKAHADEIIQIYLVDRKDHSLRIRIINNSHAFICYKFYVTKQIKEESEYPFPLDTAADILASENYISLLSKKRYEKDGWDVDMYPDGLSVAEFEFSKENPFPEILPDWIGKEVTGIYKYTNVAIAKK